MKILTPRNLNETKSVVGATFQNTKQYYVILGLNQII